MSRNEELDKLWRDFRETEDPELQGHLRDRLILQYSPLVKYVAGRLRTRMPDSVEQDDLVSDGMFGLMDAVKRFEPARGLSFQTFAVPRIRGAIIDGMRAMDIVPRSVRDKQRVVQRAQNDLEKRLGRMPEDTEVAREVGIPIQQLRDLSQQATSSNHANLDDFDLADEMSTAADHRVEEGEVSASLMQVVDHLAERDQVIIALYYFEGLTLAEIGQVLGVTESRVSQVHRRATVTMRKRLVELGLV
jgi:RNA polymerase sigma factor for flagellar operon FliA